MKAKPVHKFFDAIFTVCGIYSTKYPVTFDDSKVTCKHCIRRINKQKQNAK